LIEGDKDVKETIVDDARWGKNTREGRGQRQPSATRFGGGGLARSRYGSPDVTDL
jgi:hypothetical protein